jgi:hypothetical protein
VGFFSFFDERKPTTFFLTFFTLKNFLVDKNKKNMHYYIMKKRTTKNGVWPSGKAAGFGPAIQRFESFHPRNKFPSKQS